MLRIRDHEITRTPQGEIPQIVQCPLALFVPIGLVTTMRTRLSRVDTTGRDDLWRWQVGNRGYPFGGIGSIRTRTEHSFVLHAHMLGPQLYDKGPSEAIPKPGKDAIVSKKATPHYVAASLVPLCSVYSDFGGIRAILSGIVSQNEIGG